MEVREDDNAVIGVQHPLENHLILDLVLGYFQPLAEFKDWKSIRAVCKTWYFQTLAKWRASAVLNLKLGPTLHQNQPESPGVSMSEFLTLAENDNSSFCQFTEMPYQKYKLQNLVLDVFDVKKTSLFWTVVGPNIRHLSLYKVDIRTATNKMDDVMEFLLNQIPNLESFAVSNMYFDGQRIAQPPPVTVVYPNVKTLISNCFAFGFANFPNLQEVRLNSCGSGHNDCLLESNLFSPNELRDIDVLTNSSIERLTLENCSKSTHQFSLLRFTALKHLSCNAYIRMFPHVALIPDFIRSHAETLETIEAFGRLGKLPEGSSSGILANLPKLTVLRTWGNVFSNLEFIRYTPNLKILHLDVYGFEKQEKFKKDVSVASLDERQLLLTRDVIDLTPNARIGVGNTQWQHLNHFQIHFEIPEHSLETLAKLMPNLKTFKAIFKKTTFPMVCGLWPELENLECMFGSNILNQNITGIKEGSSDGKSNKALIDMEHLTTFKFYTECDKSLLSDDSVARGFLRVPKLTNLSICVSSEFSKEAETQLRRGIPTVQMYRNYSSNPLHNNWQCCRDNEYKKIFTYKKRFRSIPGFEGNIS